MDLSLSVDWATYLQEVIGLFAIVNPFSAVPVFAALTIGYSEHKKRNIVRVTAFSAFVILVTSFFIGEYILRFFSISIASFRIAGGSLIFLTALSMLQAQQTNIKQTEEEADEAETMESIAVVPLAMPLMAGPGSITLAIIASGNSNSVVDYTAGVVAVFLVCVSIWIILAAGSKITQALGTTGMNILTRFMGLILAAIAIEFIVAGLGEKFPGWLG